MLTRVASPVAVADAQREQMKQKKPLVRRLASDRSQQLRHAIQLAFLGLNAWLAIKFLLWTRYFESGGRTHYFDRPSGVDGWLPIAGLMNLKYFFLTHQVSAVHPAAMVLAAVFLLSSLLLKKSFCSWLCPVGSVSEVLWKLGRKLFRRNFTVPRWLDIPLRSLKYILMAFFLFIVVSMSAEALSDFMLAPFGIIADVKMLNFFREIGITGLAVLGVAGRALCVHPELLVPFPLPLRRIDGAGFHVEPGEGSAGCTSLHRLREVHKGLPVEPAGRPVGADSIRGVYAVAWNASRCARPRTRYNSRYLRADLRLRQARPQLAGGIARYSHAPLRRCWRLSSSD